MVSYLTACFMIGDREWVNEAMEGSKMWPDHTRGYARTPVKIPYNSTLLY